MKHIIKTILPAPIKPVYATFPAVLISLKGVIVGLL
jgi:hypothetical protein